MGVGLVLDPRTRRGSYLSRSQPLPVADSGRGATVRLMSALRPKAAVKNVTFGVGEKASNRPNEVIFSRLHTQHFLNLGALMRSSA